MIAPPQQGNSQFVDRVTQNKIDGLEKLEYIPGVNSGVRQDRNDENFYPEFRRFANGAGKNATLSAT